MKKLTLRQKQSALEKIGDEIRGCRICKKGKIGVAVVGEGNCNADIVFIGEAPGKQEAESGRPFIGRAGKVLRGLIAEVGLKESDVYITSPVKYLPVYVTPTPEDVVHGRSHLKKQLEIIEPKVVVLLGRVAVLALLEKNVQISKFHGTIEVKDGISYAIMYHPAAPLYNPNVRPELVKDFKKLKKLIRK